PAGQLLGQAAADFVLDGGKIAHRALESLGPELLGWSGVRAADIDPKRRHFALHAPGDEESTGACRAAMSRSVRGGDQAQAGKPRKIGHQVAADASGKARLRGVGSPALARQG